MRFTDEQIRRMADALVSALVERAGARLKADRGAVQSRAAEIIRANLSQEQDLDREAEQLLEARLRQAPPGIDRQKLLQMIKKKLAEDRGIPL